jgi:hypothetical protein
MGKQVTKIEWRIQDEEAVNREGTVPSALALEAATSNRIDFRWHAGAALVMLLITGAWLWYQAEQGARAHEAEVESELDHRVQAEMWVAANQDVELALNLAADPLVPAWQRNFGRDDHTIAMLQTLSTTSPLTVEFQVIGLEGAQADVIMTIRDLSGGIDLRQRRFYRHTETGWLRTAPSVEHWGPFTSLESKQFIFTYYQHDVKVVQRIAPQVDTLYDDIRHTLDLPVDNNRAKILVEITPVAVPGEALLRASPPDHYVIPAPSLYLAPIHVSDEQLLLQSLFLAMIPNLVDETFNAHNIRWVHQQMRHALQLWLLWNVQYPLAVAREPLVLWRLRNVSNAVQGEVAPLPQQYEELCLLHNVWLPSPSLLTIPLTCNKQDHTPMLAPAPKALSASQLEQLIANVFLSSATPVGNVFSTAQPGDAIILETLIEYVVNHYGREQLPQFISALGQHRSWTVLCPELFGVTSPVFAAGWHNFLEDHYGLPVVK